MCEILPLGVGTIFTPGKPSYENFCYVRRSPQIPIYIYIYIIYIYIYIYTEREREREKERKREIERSHALLEGTAAFMNVCYVVCGSAALIVFGEFL